MHFNLLSRLFPRNLILLIFLSVSFINGRAQELTLLWGRMSDATFEHSSFTWQIDYRQNFYRNLAASVAYINEGHIPSHHRDGTAFELWGNLPFFQEKIALSLGAGAYYYYDTTPLPGGAPGETANLHGTAPIFSASATGYLDDRWFYRLMINRINPSAQLKVTTAAVGLGYWFGPNRRPLGLKPNASVAPIETTYITEPQLTVFGGQSVVNTFLSQKAIAGALEYRQGLCEHVDVSLTGIYEGDPNIIRRNGVAPEAWVVNTFSHDRYFVGFGAGPYIFIDKKHPVQNARKSPAALAPLLSLTFGVHLSEHWVARVMFHRVTSDYNRDSDIFLLGLGYLWPH